MLPLEKAIVVEAGFTGLLVTLKWVEYYTNLFYKNCFLTSQVELLLSLKLCVCFVTYLLITVVLS